ncbi:hypothetical protein OEZ85_002992 [Tetradesmus obliquus]|uniref:Plant heme peroxidase family profile domain-containing protein n=1 Tax=Tetradesmus obliquus TaxID=3088 RepID=A0ABY8U1H6_TETOB|nr:hypothetical protein OEZ85_002992 [Tetradesmus obliquus]
MLRTAGNDRAMPKDHPIVPAPTTRKMQQASSPVSAGYLAAFRRIIVELESTIADCQFSIEGMNYANNTRIIVNSDGMFHPAASWLRAFFHDAGTFIKKPSQGGPKGGPNGSLGGSAATVELCRRENDNLHPTIQFLRGRQQRADLTFPDPAGRPNKTLSFADILVAAGVAAVKQCSKGRVIIPYTVGRP